VNGLMAPWCRNTARAHGGWEPHPATRGQTLRELITRGQAQAVSRGRSEVLSSGTQCLKAAEGNRCWAGRRPQAALQHPLANPRAWLTCENLARFSRRDHSTRARAFTGNGADPDAPAGAPGPRLTARPGPRAVRSANYTLKRPARLKESGGRRKRRETGVRLGIFAEGGAPSRRSFPFQLSDGNHNVPTKGRPGAGVRLLPGVGGTGAQ